MRFRTITQITGKIGLTPHDFFVDAKIPPSISSEWKKNNLVPSYVVPMLFKFAEKRLALVASDNSEKIKSDFIRQAMAYGYNIENGVIVFDLTKKNPHCDSLKISKENKDYIIFCVSK